MQLHAPITPHPSASTNPARDINGHKLRSLTYSNLLPKRVGNHQNIREKDRYVETKPAQLGCLRRSITIDGW
jgi:hypothetical protein